MAIIRKGNETEGIYRNGQTIQELWRYVDGAWRRVWEAIKCCFSRGWDNDKGWDNDEGWNND